MTTPQTSSVTPSTTAAAAAAMHMHHDTGTARPCSACKWQVPDPTDPASGQCTVNRHPGGGIWKRWIRDLGNTTCGRHDVGKLSFRDHV